MRYRVFRQGSKKYPMMYPQTDEPWVFTGEVEAENHDDAIRKGMDEPPVYNKVWYIAIAHDDAHGDANPEYWIDENNVIHGEYRRREW